MKVPIVSTSIGCQGVNVQNGKHIWIADNDSEFADVNSLYRVDNIGNYDVDIENAHVKRLIKGNMTNMKYSSTANILLVTIDYDPTKVFVQNTFKNSEGRIQNAWHTWLFDGDVDSIEFIGSTVYFNIVKKGTQINPSDFDAFLEVVQVFIGATQSVIPSSDTDIEFIPYLDSLYRVNKTTFADYDIFGRDVIGVDGSGNIYEGTVDIQAYLDTIGATDEIYIGHKFKFYYEFSRQLPSHYVEGAKVLETFNNLILRRLKVTFFETADFIMKTYQDLRGTVDPITGIKTPVEYSQKFEADSMTDITSSLGRVNIADGTFNFPVNSKSDDCRISIESESPFPCNFTSAEWSGNLIRKGSRY